MSKNNGIGDAGEYLVLAHFRSIGFECGIVNGEHVDIVVRINGIWRTFQVKSSGGRPYFAPGGRYDVGQKGLNEYDVDAFAFCFLPNAYPYYVAKDALNRTASIDVSAFTRYRRDSSLEELLKRWGCHPTDKIPAFAPSPLQPDMFV